jgi:hypothetical protein
LENCRVWLLGMALLGAGGCVSVTPRAERIPLYAVGDTAVSHCKKLGSLRGEASGFSQLNWDNADAQAKNNLRDAAAARWGDTVDAVVLVKLDHSLTDAVASGTGYHCAP